MKSFTTTQKTILLAGLIAMFMLVSACTEDNQTSPIIKGGEEEVPALAGTKWELIKLQNTDKNIERNIFVGDDLGTRRIPVLNFETDVTGVLEVFATPAAKDFDLTKSPMFWDYTQDGYDNIAYHFFSMMGDGRHLTSFKYEDSLIKFYHSPADGFYWDNGDGIIIDMWSYMKEIDGQWIKVEVTDSNAYNNFVFKKVQ